ncbi:MAG: hypothetical protein M3245_05815, partial [Actinomycetota bacterium]|nr:hypothetical protein [Actinomycetota bacterium]
MSSSLRIGLVAVLAAGALVAGAGPAQAFSDVPAGYFAKDQIEQVAGKRNWMRDFGTTRFEPERGLARRHLARALVRAFGSGEAPDPGISFTDLPEDSPFHRHANIAVKLGWMRAPSGAFSPTTPAT